MHIFKYPVTNFWEPLMMPEDARLLHLGEQNGVITLWALIASNLPNHPFRVHIEPTGCPFDGLLLPFIGTVQMRNGLVWHVFSDIPKFNC